jgi:hypothetical protein
MNRWIILLAAFGPGGTAPDAKEAVKQAAQNLAEQPAYAWTAAPKGDGGGGFQDRTVEGRTRKDGLTSVAVKYHETSYEIAVQGEKAALKTSDGWKAVEEIKDDGRGFRNPLIYFARHARTFRPAAAEALRLAEAVEKLDPTSDGGLTGRMTEAGSKTFLPQFVEKLEAPAGSVTFWLRDGALVKYEFEATARITVGGRTSDFKRATIVQIKDAGTAKIELPPEALKAVGREP